MSDNDFDTDGLYHGDRAIGCEIIGWVIIGFWGIVALIVWLIIFCK